MIGISKLMMGLVAMGVGHMFPDRDNRPKVRSARGPKKWEASKPLVAPVDHDAHKRKAEEKRARKAAKLERNQK